MEQTDLINAIETVLFAAAEPVTLADLRKIFTRLWGLDTPPKPLKPPKGVKVPSKASPPPPAAPEPLEKPDCLETSDNQEPADAPEAHDSTAASEPEAAAELSEPAPHASTTAQNDDTPPDPEPDPAPEPEPLTGVALELKRRLTQLDQALVALQERWAHSERGFVLLEVADGWVLRTNPRYSDVVRAMREEKPQRLSRPALETLAIVAYRQPVTKPEVDTIRGVDCGGTFKILVDRNLVRIVGKKEDVGRPLLYGTTKDFLSLFNLSSLTDLPSLREFHELNDDSLEQVRALDGASLPSLQELSQSAKQLRLDDEAATGDLDDAVKSLNTTEVSTRDALAAEGIVLPGDEAAGPPPAPATPESPSAEA